MSAQQRQAIQSPGAWLTTVTSRICLDLLGSARARRERYVGQWLPQPLPDPTQWPGGPSAATGDPADRVTLDESVGMALLVVLEPMTPAERVAFILHDVFGDAFEIVGRTAAACRQLASPGPSPPARRPGSRGPHRPAGRRRGGLQAGVGGGDVGALIGVLDPGAVAVGDGGGLVGAALGPVEGGGRIARLLVELAGRAPGGLVLLERAVSGQPGLVARRAGGTVAVYAVEVVGDRITHVWVVLNPDKLRPWATG